MFNPPITGNGELDAYLAQLALETDANNGVLVDSNTGKIYDGNTGNILYYLYQYIQVKYADDNIGTNLSNSPTNKLFFGINNSASTTESTNPADYTWYLASGGFSTNKFLFYLVNGGRQILFAVATSAPSSSYVVDSGSAIDLDVVTASTANAAAAAAQSTATAAQSTANTAISNAATAQSTADSAVSGLSGKLNKSASDILSGDITFTSAGGFKTGTIAIDGSGNVTGAGVAFTSKGIAGRTAGATTFTVDATTGNATFKGDITGASGTFSGNITGASGTFSGDIDTSGDAFFQGTNPASFTVLVSGVPYNIDYSSLSNAVSTSSGKVRAGVVGYSISLGSTFNVGVLGIGHNGFGTPGIGVVGEGDTFGGYFSGANAGLIVKANGIPNIALQIESTGKFVWNGYSILAPTGSTSTFLRNDGQWATPSGGSGTVTSVSGTGSVSGLTLSGTVTTSGNITLGGSLSLTTSDLIATAPSGSYFLSGSGWTPVTVVNTLNGASGSVTNSFAANNSIPGVAISVTGSGSNSVTYNFSSTSDRSLKKNITPIDKGLSFVKGLNPVSYLWNSEHITFDKKTYGLIANEVLEQTNEESSLVYTNTAGVFEGKLAVDYQSMVPILIKAIQELNAKVEALEAKLKV